MPITANDVHAAASPEGLLASLRWRIATKKFDPARKIPDSHWAALEEALVLAPSSYGLQAWKFFVVNDPALREKLKPLSYGQSQITDADKLVVFAAKKDFSAGDVERYVARISEVRGVPLPTLDGYKKMMLGTAAMPPEKSSIWLTRQVYIALGVFLTSAAALGIDACPMEGFDKDKYDELLGLPAKGYNAVVIATAGFRSSDDAYAAQAKVRFAKNDVVAHI